MADALDLLENLEQLDIAAIASVSLKEKKEDYLALNLEQLMEGKRRDGLDLSPSYFQDPYFRSVAAAQRYSDWKDKITPNSKRKKGVPNLFITGPFHESIGIEIIDQDIDISSSSNMASSIENKFSNDIYGLNEEKSEELIDNGLEDSFDNKIREQLGL
jgi:hypothetical protein